MNFAELRKIISAIFQGAFSKTAGMLFFYLAAKNLNRNDFETFAATFTIMAFVLTIPQSIFSSALVKYVSDAYIKNSQCLRATVSALLGFSIALMLLISILTYFIFVGVDQLSLNLDATLALIVSLYVFCLGMLSSAQGFVAGISQYKRMMQYSAYSGLVLLVSGYFLIDSHGLLGAYISITVSSFLNVALLLFLLFSNVKLEKFNIELLGFFKKERVLGYILPAAINPLATGPVVWYLTSMLMLSPDGKSYNSILVVCQQWQNLVLFIPAAVSQYLVGFFVKIKDQNKDSLKTIFSLMSLTGFLMGLIALVLIEAAPKIISYYNLDSNEALLAFYFMISAACLSGVSNVVGQYINSMDNVWSGFLLNLLWATYFILTFSILGFQYTAVAFSKMYFFAYAIHLVSVFMFLLYMMKRSVR